MSYRRDLQQLRRAQKQTKRQLRQLATLELTTSDATLTPLAPSASRTPSSLDRRSTP